MIKVLVGIFISGLLYFCLAGSAHAEGPLTHRTGKWIEIDIGTQTLLAHDGDTIIFRTIVSTGTRRNPSPLGTFHIYSKYKKKRMRGGRGKDAYDIKDVPNAMYFHKGYAIHGAYWHKRFGHRVSHGCINLRLRVARRLYNWAPIGTPVVIHR